MINISKKNKNEKIINTGSQKETRKKLWLITKLRLNQKFV